MGKKLVKFNPEKSDRIAGVKDVVCARPSFRSDQTSWHTEMD